MTAIFYLNEHWAPSDGGSLRLFPFPHPPVRASLTSLTVHATPVRRVRRVREPPCSCRLRRRRVNHDTAHAQAGFTVAGGTPSALNGT